MSRILPFALTLMALSPFCQSLAYPQEGPDGIVYMGPRGRYLTLRAGWWDPFTVPASSSTSAERVAIYKTLQQLSSIIMETPTAAKPVGFRGRMSPFLSPSTENARPVVYMLSIQAFDLFELEQNGKWILDLGGETPGIQFVVNDFETLASATGALFARDLRDPYHPGLSIYTRAKPAGTFAGNLIYGGHFKRDGAALVIPRPGREMWRPVTLGEVLPILFERGPLNSRWAAAYADAAKKFEGMTEEERNQPACAEPLRAPRLSDLPATAAPWSRVRRAGVDGCEALLAPDWAKYLDRTLPRTAVQLISIPKLQFCLEPRDGQMVLEKSFAGSKTPGGCPALVKILSEIDWNKFAGLLAK